jgi:hypothetical protein
MALNSWFLTTGSPTRALDMSRFAQYIGGPLVETFAGRPLANQIAMRKHLVIAQNTYPRPSRAEIVTSGVAS